MVSISFRLLPPRLAAVRAHVWCRAVIDDLSCFFPRSRHNAYASASALQVVLWRVRYFMMLPRAVGIWVMLLAYSALLAAIFFGQAVSDRDFRPRVGSGFRGGEL